MCSPIDLRIRDSGSPWPAATGAGSAAGAGGGGRGRGRRRRGRGLRLRWRGVRRRGRLRRARRGRLGPVRRLDVHRRLGPLLDRARPAVLEVGEHVLLAHAPVAPGALDLRQVEAVLGGHPRDDRAVAPALVAVPGAGGVVGRRGAGLGRGRRRGRRRGRPGRGRRLARGRLGRRAVAVALVLAGVRLARAGVGRDAREDGADVDRRADGDDDLGHPARGRRRAPRCRSCRSRCRRSAPRTRPSRRAACATRRSCPRRPRRPSAA